MTFTMSRPLEEKLLTNAKSLAEVFISSVRGSLFLLLQFMQKSPGCLLNVNQAGLEAEAVGGLLIC